MTICGCKSSLCSMMTVPIKPVASSTSRLIVTPAIMSRNSILPLLSVRIGTLYGSHCTKVSPFFTLAPSSFEIMEPKFAVVLRFDDWLLKCLTGRSTDVEGTHGQLRAGLADRLRGNNADGL